ncbi:hypothetical protein FSB78_10080 [Sphingomonas ginsenosidivorax]|uniref:Uncharacterized protein n=1 Tax=Sphingomonas ginsenosidivorax TaxID=862135 RepID=A0A5C6UFK9_9SPHN|nr:hypothetical protein [Sphingomonas ginsenosidivorax]TXC71254.1 hypothetical protein FSB78_10080 [Sphingomonas ginsenosidivorax]
MHHNGLLHRFAFWRHAPWLLEEMLIGTVALGQPYAVKSRFTFAVGHLSHQANKAKDLKGWKNAFPDKNLYLNDIEPFGKPWRAFRRFKRTLEPLAGSALQGGNRQFPQRL